MLSSSGTALSVTVVSHTLCYVITNASTTVTVTAAAMIAFLTVIIIYKLP